MEEFEDIEYWKSEADQYMRAAKEAADASIELAKEIGILKRELTRERALCDQAHLRAGERWKQYDAEKQHHSITKCEREALRAALRRIWLRCNKDSVPTHLCKDILAICDEVKI